MNGSLNSVKLQRQDLSFLVDLLVLSSIQERKRVFKEVIDVKFSICFCCAMMNTSLSRSHCGS